VVEASGVMVHWLGRSGWGLSGRGHGSESKIGGHGGSGFYGGHGRICDLWPMGGGEGEEGVHRPVGLRPLALGFLRCGRGPLARGSLRCGHYDSRPCLSLSSTGHRSQMSFKS
jgi:hypothetical protein